MAEVNVKLKLSFASGEEQMFSAQLRQPSEQPVQPKRANTPPYRLPRFTAPDEPELVESANFTTLR